MSGLSWGHVRLCWGSLGTPLGRHGALWDTSGPSWAVVGCLRKLGAVLGRTRLHDGFLFCLGVLRHGCAIQDGSLGRRWRIAFVFANWSATPFGRAGGSPLCQNPFSRSWGLSAPRKHGGRKDTSGSLINPPRGAAMVPKRETSVDPSNLIRNSRAPK